MGVANNRRDSDWGLRIGKNTTVLPGSIVTNSLPENAIVGGMPAAISTSLSMPKVVQMLRLVSSLKEFVLICQEMFLIG